MTLRVALLSVILVPSISIAAEIDVAIPTRQSTKVNYEWISLLAEGPAAWLATGERAQVQGKVLRMVIYAGTEEMPSTYRIEEITFGQEGCCRKLLRAREFQLYDHMKAFGPFNRKEGREFEFIKWLSPSSLEFKHFGNSTPFMTSTNGWLRSREPAMAANHPVNADARRAAVVCKYRIAPAGYRKR